MITEIHHSNSWLDGIVILQCIDIKQFHLLRVATAYILSLNVWYILNLD